jgi:hypothetical protein
MQVGIEDDYVWVLILKVCCMHYLAALLVAGTE